MIPEHKEIEKLYKNWQKALVKASDLRFQWEKALKKAKLTCFACKDAFLISDLVYIEWMNDLYRASWDDGPSEYENDLHSLFVCPNCSNWNKELQKRPEFELFRKNLYDFKKHFKKVLKYRYGTQLDPEVFKLMKPVLDAQEKDQKERERQDRIKQARAILEREGIKIEGELK